MQHNDDETVMDAVRDAIRYYRKHPIDFVAELLCAVSLFGVIYILLLF